MVEIFRYAFFGILFCFVLYAIIFEYKEQSNAYKAGMPDSKDKLVKSMSKLKMCLTYDTKTIKWRRILITTVLACILIFGFIHVRFPTTKELLLYITFIFICFYINWNNHVSRSGSEAISYGIGNLENIKSSLISNYFFI